MKAFALLLALLLHASTSLTAAPSPVPVVRLDGRDYVAASQLARSAGIAVKQLSGQNAVAACIDERCALVKDFRSESGEILVAVEALGKALAATTEFDSARSTVRFQWTAQTAAAPTSLGAPGTIAPELKLVRLDGTPVALSDFRGKRVLINSWASW